MNISINTIVSTLSTVAIFTLMSPLGVALGQCKWLLFRREERPLSHLSHLDGASRGPFGCIKLFGRRQYYGPLPSIGALLIIMALAVNPFMQQLIRYRFRDIENGTALLPVSYGYGSTSDDDSYAGHIAMKAAVYSGFSSPGDSDFNVTSYCPSDNCTWPPFQTMGVCGSCEDLTPLVERIPIAPELFSGGGPSNFRLPNGFIMTTKSTLKDNRSPLTYMNISTTGSMYSNLYNTTDDFILNNMSIAFQDRGSLMLNFFALRLDGLSTAGDDVSFAKECVLQYCVKNITAVQRKGELVETVSGTWTNNSEAARKFSKGDLQAYSSPLYYLQPPGQERVFRVGHAAQAQMAEWLDLVLVGTAARQPPDAGQFFTTDLIQGIDRVVDRGESGLEALVSNVAGAMTAALRARSRDSASVVFVSEPYIHIDWVWIIFPLLLYVLAVAFVITVALQGRGDATRCHVWKNSIVAALCHGLEAELSGKLANLYTQEQIDEASTTIKVKLAMSGVGLQLVSVEPQELLQWQARADGAGG